MSVCAAYRRVSVPKTVVTAARVTTRATSASTPAGRTKQKRARVSMHAFPRPKHQTMFQAEGVAQRIRASLHPFGGDAFHPSPCRKP